MLQAIVSHRHLKAKHRGNGFGSNEKQFAQIKDE